MLKVFRAAIVPFAILLLVCGYLYLGTSSVSYKKCQSYKAEYQTDSSYDSSPRVTRWGQVSLFFECEAYFSDQNGGLITAFASIAIAAFTLTLWWATAEHGRISDRVLQLARDEFHSTHRPRIRVKHVWLKSEIWMDEKIMIDLAIVNSGNTTAIITQYSMATLIISKDDVLPNGHDEWKIIKTNTKVTSGLTILAPGISDGRVLSDPDNANDVTPCNSSRRS